MLDEYILKLFGIIIGAIFFHEKCDKGKFRMDKLNLEAIKVFYDSIENVWPRNNAWYSYLKSRIETYIRKNYNQLDNAYILNAGSGGNDYGIISNNMYHVDIAKDKIAHLKNATVASIEDLPFPDEMFDYSICVGSVLNYCDAIASISEMARVLKRQGRLILEFENSHSFEYLGKSVYGNSAEIVTTKYLEQSHKLWVYSFDYIRSILKEYSFDIRNSSALHVLSGLLLNKKYDENTAAKLAKFDRIFQYIPYFKKRASNIILLCEKL